MEFTDIVKSLRTLAGEHFWITQVFVVIFVCLLLAFIQKVLLRRLHDKLLKTRYVWDDALVDAMRGPVTVFIWLVGIAFAVQIVGYETEYPLFQAVEPLRDVGIIAVIAWFTIRFIKVAQDNIRNKRIRRGETYDPTTADAVSKLLIISVVITAALVMLQTLGFSISGVLAFGGVGGIAMGFAARDLLANFFGGLMIYLDRPFAVGEWVRSPDRDIEGTVEEIGWRLTRIRTFDKRPLYVPNAAFTTITLQNPSRMTNRRIFETIGVRYDDAQKLNGILEDVRSMLKDHEDIDQGQLMMVYFNEFAASSLDFFVYCFTRTTAWAEYHRVKEDVLFRIMDIILAHGAEVAFPTSTLHVPDGIGIWEEPATGTGQNEQR
ncbi:MAG TPA: mechanosensitive ion channel family protein [Deltaproteobacteria bacterium]|nr:mechanosensitive ion channel family protein [Deltaproteobacteria bacterium]